MIWLGNKNNVKKAKNIFWDSLYDYVKLNYEVQPVIAVDKLTSFYNQSVSINQIKKIPTHDNLIWRVELKNLIKNVDEYRSSCGYFFEYHASSLSEINKIINKKYQTLAYYGITHNELNEFVKRKSERD